MGKGSRDTFLDDAERVIRPHVQANPNLYVWRGPYPRKYFLNAYEYETVVVGMGDDQSKAPSVVFLKVWREGRSAYMEYDDNDTGENNTSSTGPDDSVLGIIREKAPLLTNVLQ